MDWFTYWQQSDFWIDNIPGEHFVTAPALGAEFAAMVLAYARQQNTSTVVDLGAGDGHLLTHLHRLDPELSLHGLDQRPGPVGIPWTVDKYDVARGLWSTGAAEQILASYATPILLVAVEWLDDLPCTIAVRDPELRSVGPECNLRTLPEKEREWAERWWPSGDAVEIGLTRDEAWLHLSRLLPPGSTMLCIDYGHSRQDRPAHGSFTGYRHGVRCEPGPDMNLTAHVAFDSLAAALEDAGHQPCLRARQSELGHLLPPLPSDPLAALASRSVRHALLSPERFGSFHWLAHRVAEPATP